MQTSREPNVEAILTAVFGDTALTHSLIPVSDSGSIADIWRDFDRNGQHGFFVTWAWVRTLLELLPPDSGLKIFAAERNGTIAGLALVAQRTMRRHGLFPVRQLVFNATGDQSLDCVMVEHNGFASSAAAAEPWLDLFSLFEQTGADELLLPGIASSAVLPSLPPGLQATRANSAYRTSLDRLHEKDGLSGLLSSNSRQQLARSLRACQELGPLHLQRATDVSSALSYFLALKNFHISSWTKRGRDHAFAHSFFEKFHRSLIATAFEEGTIDLLRITAGDTDLGYLYNFKRNGIISSYQSGFNIELNALRPGYVCHALAIEHYAKSGAWIYDFLAGRNRLKQTFATEQYEMFWYRFRRPTLLFRAEAAVRSTADFFRQKRSFG